MLRGPHGARVTVDWASRKQPFVAQPSGEAETVALHDALGSVSGASRSLCATGIPAMDAFEKLLDKKMELRA